MVRLQAQAATAPSSGRKRTGAAPSRRFSKLQDGADEDDAADGISLSVGPTPTRAQELGACTASVAELTPKQEKEEEDEASETSTIAIDDSDTSTIAMDDSDAAADPSKAPVNRGCVGGGKGVIHMERTQAGALVQRGAPGLAIRCSRAGQAAPGAAADGEVRPCACAAHTG
eukprot:CAMPEP_0206154102 /NCGR_PEP_ID=MMETSP1474-20131121/1117_1 /ASSEMBLY_ACC=CAM_ASM_001110 /TAXON_ID=97495 /ORGANISM="Imantonia sp., Strain RCC918" /LENGTH=171 /DNA_ID=CAMNT_0053552161 /DNA_START=198 /DNA_END=709 /DNA_ORIENTATION=-